MVLPILPFHEVWSNSKALPPSHSAVFIPLLDSLCFALYYIYLLPEQTLGIIRIFSLFKKKITDPKWGHQCSAHISKPRLNARSNGGVSASLRIVFSTSLESPAEHSGVICLTDPHAVPPKEGDLVSNNLLFASSLFACSYLPIKVFQFAQLFRAPFYLLNGMLPNS